MQNRFRFVTTVALVLAASLPTEAATTHFAQLKGNPSLQSASALVTDVEGHVIDRAR